MKMEPILLISADTPEELRHCDVDRVMEEAYKQGCFSDFRSWLLSRSLQARTKEKVENFTEAIFEEE